MAGRLTRVLIEVPYEDYHRAVVRICKSGLLHVAKPKLITAGGIPAEDHDRLSRVLERLRTLIANVRGLVSRLEEFGLDTPEGGRPLAADDLVGLLDELEDIYGWLEEHVSYLMEELERILSRAEMASRAYLLRRALSLGGEGRHPPSMRHFRLVFFTIEEKVVGEILSLLQGIGVPHYYRRTEGRRVLFMCVVTPEGVETLLSALKIFEVEVIPPDIEVSIPLSEGQVRALRRTLLRSVRLPGDLSLLKAVVDDLAKIGEVVSNSYCVDGRVCVEGYLPSNMVDVLRRALGDGGARLIDLGPDSESPSDSVMRGPLLGFRDLVEMYGGPRRHEVDPAPVLFVTFPLFFGMMFGDLGQGLVLALAGLIAYRRDISKNWGVVLTACGLWSMIFGLVFGEVFGHPLEEVLHVRPLLPMHGSRGINPGTIATLMGISILIGIAHQLFALFLKAVGEVRGGHPVRAVTRSLAMAATYVLGVLYFAPMVTGEALVDPRLAVYSMALLLALFIMGEPLALLLRRGLHSAAESFGEGVIELIMLLMEPVSYTHLTLPTN